MQHKNIATPATVAAAPGHGRLVGVDMEETMWDQPGIDGHPEGSAGRVCNRCGQWKPADGFYERRGKPVSICRACVSAAAIAKKPPIDPKACEWCGEMFKPKQSNKGRFCSIKCQRTARERRSGTKPFLPAVADGQKRCVTCMVSKPLGEFGKRTDRNKAPLSSCRVCAKRNMREWQQSEAGRNTRYLATYGVTVEWYESTLAGQCGVCAICRQLPAPSKTHPRLVIDHDHRTGKARGLLCGKCNSGLGRLRDDPYRIHALIAYLLRADEAVA